MRRWSILLATLFLLAACGADDTPVETADGDPPGNVPSVVDDPPVEVADEGQPGNAPPGPPATEYQAVATVLESSDHGPQLCLGGVASSYPPQCGGPDITNWDWADVEHEDESGTRWGAYTVVGTWDGERFTLTEPPRDPEPREGTWTDFSTPCEPPAGGWSVVDPATTTDEAQNAAISYARAQAEFGGAWVDQSINPATDAPDGADKESAMNDPAALVLNLRFTARLDEHEAAVRERWGGSLCVSQADHTLAELLEIQSALSDERDDVLVSSVDEVRGIVRLEVIVAEAGDQDALDERYGAGVVELTGALQPVSS